LQKVSGKVNLTQIQLCGGENPTCYIMNKCKEPPTTTTTMTITTSTTTTIVYECHCKVFAEKAGPGCSGKCCIRSSNEGGEGFDSDCMTQKDENSCNTRTNGANENFCVYASRAHWRTMEMSR
jgi:hypothetical protein